MLAVAWGMQRMNLYLQGSPHFDLVTDSKPLILILISKPSAELLPRIPQLDMKIFKYSFTARHIAGKKLIDADALSQAPVKQMSLANLQNEEDIDARTRKIRCKLVPCTCRAPKVELRTTK